jgi:hypothetical protein
MQIGFMTVKFKSNIVNPHLNNNYEVFELQKTHFKNIKLLNLKFEKGFFVP